MNETEVLVRSTHLLGPIATLVPSRNILYKVLFAEGKVWKGCFLVEALMEWFSARGGSLLIDKCARAQFHYDLRVDAAMAPLPASACFRATPDGSLC